MISCKTYEQLSKEELYSLLKLRQDVFIIEQASIYGDIDDLDEQALHYLVYQSTPNDSLGLLGYARSRKVQAKDTVKIERVVLHPSVRNEGLGKVLVNRVLKDALRLYPSAELVLSAQTLATGFYQKFGFEEFGQPYDDCGIEHIDMRYPLPNLSV